jgi:hypothetical protein
MIRFTTAAVAILFASAAIAAQDNSPPSATLAPNAASGDDKVICHYVLTADRGSKPYRLCMTKAKWKLAQRRDASDPNRIECHIEENPATRLGSYKICQPASAWQDRQREARETIEQIQRGSCVPGGGCPGG